MRRKIRQRGGNVGDLNLLDEASAPRREKSDSQNVQERWGAWANERRLAHSASALASAFAQISLTWKHAFPGLIRNHRRILHVHFPRSL